MTLLFEGALPEGAYSENYDRSKARVKFDQNSTTFDIPEVAARQSHPNDEENVRALSANDTLYFNAKNIAKLCAYFCK